MITQQELQARLDSTARKLNVPGAAIAVAKGDQVVTAVTGVTNVTTGAPVVPETLFAAGSVTKVFTATLVMTLVDEGLVDLDTPVREYLPDFVVGEDPRSAEVTTRMLLNHSSGLPGNFTYDLPKGPDNVAGFVELLREYEFNSPPGSYWSYSNAGLVTAGRVAEVVTGRTFDQALAERVLRPLELNATSDTDEMILGSTAVGHVVDAQGNIQRVPRFQLGTNAPSGSALALDVGALVTFGRMHLANGRSEGRRRVLTPESVTAMQVPQLDLPWRIGYDAFGLGWAIRNLNGHTLLGHTGASAGQHSTLDIIPDQQGVLAALTNSTTGAALFAELCAELLDECFDARPDAPPRASDARVELDLTPYVGVYTADDGRLVVTEDDGALRVRIEADPLFGEMMKLILGEAAFPPPPLRLTPYAADGRFVSDVGIPIQFVTPVGSEVVDYAYAGRIYRRGA